MIPSGSLFITGTDTDVGKSVAAAWLMEKMGADYWKPIQAGLDGETDRDVVERLSGLPKSHFHPTTFNLTSPLSPHEAARRDGVKIQLQDFILPTSKRELIVEGAGGLLVPLNEKDFIIDLIQLLKLPAVLVARSGLGTINHTLLSLDQLRQRKIPIAGVIINGPINPGNRQAIMDYGQVDIIGEIPHLTPLNAKTLSAIR